MIDPKRLMKAKAEGIAFLCRMCVHWYTGEDLGLKDKDGDPVCTHVGKCGSPVVGLCFEGYTGPLEDVLKKYCYICGVIYPQKALSSKYNQDRRVGCCNDCFENRVKNISVR